jgi:hypothetical protein
MYSPIGIGPAAAMRRRMSTSSGVGPLIVPFVDA